MITAESAIRKLLAMHTQMYGYRVGDPDKKCELYCKKCEVPWPCPTGAVLERVRQ